MQTGTAGYRKLVTTGGTASGWVSEVAARPETDTPTFAEIAPPTGELYANPAASQAMLDDAGVRCRSLAGERDRGGVRPRRRGAFVSGTGINQPEGFLTAANAATDDAARAFGTLQYVGRATPPGSALRPTPS